jgi:GntR family transcriptional repressor for pyruvate dehydrogenase complex
MGVTRIETVRRTSTAEAIVEHLLGRIRNGEFGPGDWLPSERQLQAQLGVGRLSLREALARLAALGIIRVDHGKGACVQERISVEAVVNAFIPSFPDLNAKTLRDLVNARSLIEGELSARAALTRTDADTAALKAILDSSAENINGAARLAELDYSFHREIARIADNDFLRVVVGALSDHTRSFLLHFYMQEGRDKLGIIQRHRPILEAIAHGEPERARVCTREHIDASKSNLDAYVEWVTTRRANGGQQQ